MTDVVVLFLQNRFKVFVYEDVPEALNADLRTKRSDKCKDNGYANAEWKIPELIAKSEVYTPDPELADFYVVPLFPECYVRDKLEKGGADYVTAVRKVNKMYQAAIDRIAGNYPYWRRSEGRDHVFIFPAEKGAENVLNEKTLERIGKAIKIVGVPTFKSSLSSSGGEDSDGDGSNRGDSNSESLEEEEKEEEENNSAKAMATRRARYAFSPFRDIIVPPVRDSRDEAYALVKAEMENVFSARRKIRMHFRGKVVSEDDEFFGAGGSGSSSESGGSDTKTDSSTDGRRKSSSSSSFNVRRRAYEQLKGLKGVNVVIDESNTAGSFEVTGGIETDKGRKNATFSSSSSCDRKCVLREMRNSETCLITPHGGLEGWSTALSDAILSGCVPLIVHDDFEPYFSDVLDWENFSYKIPTREALRNAKDALLHEKSKASSITRSKRENDLKIAARASVWNDKWQSGDALDALFESLRRRVRYHRNSPFRFYAEADRNG
ncbi:exostosin family protein [bacterium]|nr:exostosin family protein [bacterium]